MVKEEKRMSLLDVMQPAFILCKQYVKYIFLSTSYYYSFSDLQGRGFCSGVGDAEWQASINAETSIPGICQRMHHHLCHHHLYLLTHPTVLDLGVPDILLHGRGGDS